MQGLTLSRYYLVGSRNLTSAIASVGKLTKGGTVIVSLDKHRVLVHLTIVFVITEVAITKQMVVFVQSEVLQRI